MKPHISKNARCVSAGLNLNYTQVELPQRKLQINQPGGSTHSTNQGTAETLHQGGGEAIACLGAHRIKAAAAVESEGEGCHRETGGVCQGCETAQRTSRQ